MRRLALVGLMLLTLAACGQASRVEVTDAWTRDTVGRTASAAVFMTITSPGTDRLISASAPVANETGLMTMETGGGAMAMAYVDAIDLPADTPVSLNPSGLHVWLEDLKQPFSAGQTFSLVLEFEKAGEQHVEVSVIAPAAAPPMAGMGM